MSDDGLERKHEASSKRLADLSKKGQSLRSRDLSSGIIIFTTIISLVFLADTINLRLKDNFIWSFTHVRYVLSDVDFPGQFIGTIAIDNLKALMPLLVLCLLSAFVAPFIFGGWNFTLEVLHFKVEKFNVIANLKNIFSTRIFVEMGKSLLKLFVFLGLLIYFTLHNIDYIFGLIHQQTKHAIVSGIKTSMQFIVLMSIGLVLIVLFDVIYSYFEFHKRSKMTSQELKDEHKESEGNPEVKRKIRIKQMSLIRQRLMVAVPQANVIVTNPTHYAVALRYQPGKDAAPVVVAKGKDFIAQQIRTIAISHGVTIYQAPELARAIYHTANINSQISPELYMSVALVLSYVHQLKNYQAGNGTPPQVVTDLRIPEEFIYNE